ncbi:MULTISPECIES: hypothetical protein [unclassified Flavobacterium]|uniref:hypothetical protein n=1 Tax=unclassified Flavobacterium TaxID=196869 RepID=UPI0025B8E050|nr:MULTISPECIES: hypothetical protein [unclassified Flavobacterium]
MKILLTISLLISALTINGQIKNEKYYDNQIFELEDLSQALLKKPITEEEEIVLRDAEYYLSDNERVEKFIKYYGQKAMDSLKNNYPKIQDKYNRGIENRDKLSSKYRKSIDSLYDLKSQLHNKNVVLGVWKKIPGIKEPVYVNPKTNKFLKYDQYTEVCNLKDREADKLRDKYKSTTDQKTAENLSKQITELENEIDKINYVRDNYEGEWTWITLYNGKKVHARLSNGTYHY